MERGDPPADAAQRLRALPAVHELAAKLDGPHTLAVAAARQAIEEQRRALQAGGPATEDVEPRARELLESMRRPSLRPVINATGVIVHTNLGRAPLPTAARDAVAAAATGYSNLELELESGERGSRHAHVEGLLEELTGAEAAIAVNNGAAAVLLAVAALGGPSRAVAVSRGQLVEIGGGFRIPDVVAQSGATLVEVGTTNRTRLSDYERVLAADPDAVVLRVHQSNFRAVGFVEDVSIEALCELGVPVIDDVGSGVLADAAGIPALGDEPSIKHSLEAGAALVCCSGDKLLGGPQAGLIVGKRAAVAVARAHPLARAMRIDKLSLAALEATLRLYREPELARREIPVLAMLDAPEGELAARAQKLADGVGPSATVIQTISKVGGGALPLLELEGPAVALESETPPTELAKRLRAADPPVLARIHDGRVLLDPRTLRDGELDQVIAAARAASG
ncbi:MAG TPA: L-seryl-tRNA(Sec) selenium transferase [Solirubrobacteraceae bacterium]